jgi:hypothetical protein
MRESFVEFQYRKKVVVFKCSDHQIGLSWLPQVLFKENNFMIVVQNLNVT